MCLIVAAIEFDCGYQISLLVGSNHHAKEIFIPLFAIFMVLAIFLLISFFVKKK